MARRLAAIPVLIAAICVSLQAISPAPQDVGQTDREIVESLEHLGDEGDWQALLERAADLSPDSADRIFYEGIALAGLDRRKDAAERLRRGASLFPDEQRFPLELAGIEYRERAYDQARENLRRALKIDPDDSYAAEFLATLYFLDGRLLPALEYWNHVGRPRLDSIEFRPEPGLDPVLLNRAISATPGEVLTVRQMRDSTSILESLQLFSRIAPELAPGPSDSYTLTLRLLRKQGLESGAKWAALSALREIPFETLHLDLFNLDHRGLSVQSRVRWNAHRRWATFKLSRPFPERPDWQWRVSGNWRAEDWRFPPPDLAQPEKELQAALDRQDARFHLTKTAGSRWWLTSGLRFTKRTWTPSTTASAPLSDFSDGDSLHYRLESGREILYDPARDLRLTLAGSFEAGRFLNSSRSRMGLLAGDLNLDWPLARSSRDWRIQVGVRGGSTFGDPPVDEQFSLGLDRDHNRGMRAHPAFRDGYNGSAPIGRRLFLVRSDIEKRVWERDFLTISLAPFCDLGKVSAGAPSSQPSLWLVDTGVEFRVRLVSGVGFNLALGRDLRQGRTSVFAYSPEFN